MTYIIYEFIQYFFLQTILCKFFVFSQLGFSANHSKIQAEKTNQDPKSIQRSPSSAIIRRDEVEFVMGNLGIPCHPKGKNFPESLSCNDVFSIFENENPRLDEVKGAFDVFDENKDGFVDARELKRVLLALGLKERAEIDECKKMIRVFDDNDDGRIDFDEFVKFMEGTFC